MQIIEAALFTNLAAKPRKHTPQPGLGLRGALRRLAAFVLTIGLVVAALHIAAAGAASHPQGEQIASLSFRAGP